jgi:hypothetical protein
MIKIGDLINMSIYTNTVQECGMYFRVPRDEHLVRTDVMNMTSDELKEIGKAFQTMVWWGNIYQRVFSTILYAVERKIESEKQYVDASLKYLSHLYNMPKEEFGVEELDSDMIFASIINLNGFSLDSQEEQLKGCQKFIFDVLDDLRKHEIIAEEWRIEE